MKESQENKVSQNELEKEKVPGKDMSLGEERYNAISNSLKNAHSKMGSWFSKAGSFLKIGAFRALETPENVVAGTRYTGAKIAEGATFVADKTVEGVKATGHGIALGAERFAEGAEYTSGKIAEGAEFVADKTTEGAKFVAGKTVEGLEYIGEKTEQFGDWVEGGAKSAYQFSSEQYKKAESFAVEKGEKMKEYVLDKADLIEAAGGFLKEKTGEKLNVAKEGIVNVYNGVMEYGKGAVDSATLRAQQVKENFNSKWNAFRMDMLQRKAEVQRERLEKTQRKLAQFNQVAELGNNLA